MFRVVLASEQQIANGAAAVSGGSFGVAYFAGLNEVLTTIALLLAIISGVISLWKHFYGKRKKED